MRKKRRQAVAPSVIDEPEYLGDTIPALMGDGNAPVNLGNLKDEPYPDLNPFHGLENINKVANKEELESQGEREARLARRLVLLRRRW